MRRRWTIVLLVIALAVSGLGVAATPAAAGPNDPDTPWPQWQLTSYPATENDNVILKWNEELLQTIRANPATTGPTVTARAIGVLHTATFDAWAAYDAVAKGTRLGGTLRRPARERTLANKAKAISFAAYETLTWLFPARQPDYKLQMDELGYTLSDQTTPAKVGRQAAQAVIAYRSTDGSNQANGYADTTGYRPVNDWNVVRDPWRWQPLCVPDPGPDATTCTGSVQRPLTPQWGGVTPFAVTPYTHLSVPGPAKLPSGQYDPSEITELYEATIELTDVEKVRAEYWADGPRSEFPPGHWCMFGQVVSRRRNHSLDTDAKMFFALGNALMDASIIAWRLKYKYDFVRPQTAIREYYSARGEQVQSWLGPYRGWGWVDADQWRPYQAPNVVTPPFPEYTSGHSTFSAAAAYVLRWFTGSDVLGAEVTIPAGSSLFEPRTPEHPGTPATDVTLRWPLLSDAADDAGISRRNGGIHFKSGDMHGRSSGQAVGGLVVNRADQHIRGTS